MKKIVSCSIIFMLTLTGLRAQPVVPKKSNRWGAGVFGGLAYVYPRIQTPWPVHFTARTTVLAGVDIRHRLSRRSFLHMQPSWTRIDNHKPASVWQVADPVFRFDIVKIPVLYRYYVLPARRFLFVEAGPAYNQLAKSNYRKLIPINCITGPCPVQYTPNLAASGKVALSGIVGVGVNFDIGKCSIPVTLHYERYVNSYIFPAQSEQQPHTPVHFESFALTTGVNF